MNIMRGRAVVSPSQRWVVRRDHDGVWRWDDPVGAPKSRDELLRVVRLDIDATRSMLADLEAVLAGLEGQPPWNPETWGFVEPSKRVEVNAAPGSYFMAQSDDGLVCWQKDQVERDRSVPVGSSPPRMWRPKEAK